MTHANRFALPDVGEGLTEAEIVTWYVKVGDTVAINDVLVEIETAKSLVELPSPFAGVIAQLHAEVGQTVDVGTVLVTFGGGDDSTDADTAPQHEVAPVAEQAPAQQLSQPSVDDEDDEVRQPVLVGYGPSRAKVQRRPRKPGYRATIAHRSITGAVPAKLLATPPIRARARQLGVNLADIAGNGPGGRITRSDLDAYVAARQTTAPVEAAEIRTPIKGVRKATAAAMVTSAFSAPHVTEWVTVDVTESLELLEHLRKDRAFAGARLTPLVLIARAALSALQKYPAVNAKWDEAAGEIVEYRDVNLGIAAATPRGLIVPNIKAAQRLSTRDLCDSLDELVTEARAGKTQPASMARGTFTITNIGVFGIDGGTPILNPGEAAILCVGQIVRRPWEFAGEIALRQLCTLSLSFDHRLVDGQLGSQLLSHIARLLAQPALALVD